MVRPLRSAVQDAEITPGDPDGKRKTIRWAGPGNGYTSINKNLTFTLIENHFCDTHVFFQGGQNDITSDTTKYSLCKRQRFTGKYHELNWKASGPVISSGQDRLESLPVLVVLTNDGPLPRLLQVTICYWLKGDDAFTVLSGLPVDGRVYRCAIWTS